jgi:hypothetical protein
LAGLVLALVAGVTTRARAEGPGDTERFQRDVLPLLEDYCFGCHGNGAQKAGVAFDRFETDAAVFADRELWARALRQLRAGLMPPKEPKPSEDEIGLIADWIKSAVFQIDPANPDPGRMTVRRLNRIEYRNTIRELLGIDFDTAGEFPPDDTGHGFDNIGSVLSISPLLLEKYIAAAQEIVGRAVPMTSGVVAEHSIPGRRFRKEGEQKSDERGDGRMTLSYYEPARATATWKAENPGAYQLVFDLSANERYVDGEFDYNRCRLVLKADGEELLRQEMSRQGNRPYRFEFDRQWEAGEHELAIEVEPLTPGEKQVRSLAVRVNSVVIRGPLSPEFWVRPPDYDRFFPRAVPDSPEERRAYARELLERFATRAYRRPVDAQTLDRLVALAESVFADGSRGFESGIARAMTVVLASPRFLFLEEGIEPESKDRFPLVDEYSLASRLSYFLWSSMPDDELFRLASENQLRTNLQAQLARMLADPRAGEFLRHFPGQWLQARDIESVPINAFAVIRRDQKPDPEAEKRQRRFRELRRKEPEELSDDEKKELEELRANFGRSFRRFRDLELTGELRAAMRRETEMLFAHVVKEDRSVLELIDCDYTFLNERLAKFYEIEGVEGDEMRRVELPPESPRGGVLTQATLLAVTSNPDRTSPVKRGLFILDNILGTPPAPPPPDIPALEEAGKAFEGRDPTLRETLALHRKDALCSSCHNRMDPLGLSLENFNALGRWREQERGNPIDASGTLITGESFENVRQLKKILVNERRRDYYRCLSEKLLTYALGRGLEHADVHTIDGLVQWLEESDGRASVVISGIVESAPFQRRRRVSSDESVAAISPARGDGK